MDIDRFAAHEADAIREDFQEYFDLAQSGELQSATEKLGPLTYNPYVRQNNLAVYMVALSIDSVISVGQEEAARDRLIYTQEEVIEKIEADDVKGVEVRTAVKLAEAHGLVEGVSKFPNKTFLRLTDKGTETEQVYVPSIRPRRIDLLDMPFLFSMVPGLALANAVGVPHDTVVGTIETVVLGSLTGVMGSKYAERARAFQDAVRAHSMYQAYLSRSEGSTSPELG